MRHIGTAERRGSLAVRHRLRPALRTNDVVAIADDLVAFHSSDPATVFLSAFARMSEPSAALVGAALYEDRTLLRFHAMRRTIWVANPSMVAAMNAASTRKVAAAERKQLLRFLGMSEGVGDAQSELAHLEAELLAVVAAEAPITTREIGILRPDLTRKVTIGSGNFTIEAGAHTRVASLAGFEARLIRGRPKGTWAASEYSWNLAADWVDLDFDAIDERTGCAVILRAWLDRFGPGTETDLRWWTGWTASAVRHALADLDAVKVTLDGDQIGWVLPDDNVLDDVSASAVDYDEPWVAVLPSLDPTVMGWKERGWYLTDEARARVFDRNGNAGPTIVCNGEVVGGWVQQSSGDLAVELVHSLTSEEETLLNIELERLRTAIGDVRFRVRFPSPNQEDLFA